MRKYIAIFVVGTATLCSVVAGPISGPEQHPRIRIGLQTSGSPSTHFDIELKRNKGEMTGEITYTTQQKREKRVFVRDIPVSSAHAQAILSKVLRIAEHFKLPDLGKAPEPHERGGISMSIRSSSAASSVSYQIARQDKKQWPAIVELWDLVAGVAAPQRDDLKLDANKAIENDKQ